jgi:hypothetical protein
VILRGVRVVAIPVDVCAAGIECQVESALTVRIYANIHYLPVSQGSSAVSRGFLTHDRFVF